MDRDERRWKKADRDSDGQLNKMEFQSFLHPEDYPHMVDIVVLETLEDMDTDGDGAISEQEYIADIYKVSFTVFEYSNASYYPIGLVIQVRVRYHIKPASLYIRVRPSIGTALRQLYCFTRFCKLCRLNLNIVLAENSVIPVPQT